MPDQHHERSPSRCNALAQCPAYRPSPAGEAADRGTALHLAVQAAVDGETYDIADEDRIGVEWAADYIRSLGSSMPEVWLSLPDDADPFGPPITAGTVDWLGDGFLIEVKSGQSRDYTPQITLYALMAMTASGEDSIWVHTLYIDRQNAQVKMISLTDAKAYQADLWAKMETKTPTPCDYCSWCSSLADCPALAERVTAVAKHNNWRTIPLDPAALAEPEHLAAAWELAGQLEGWCEAVKSRVRELVKGGATMTGYRMQEVRGRQSIDVIAAYQAAAIPPEDFLACCDVSVPQLRKAFARSRQGILDVDTGKPATQKALETSVFDAAMSDALKTGAPSLRIMKTKEKASEANL